MTNLRELPSQTRYFFFFFEFGSESAPEPEGEKRVPACPECPGVPNNGVAAGCPPPKELVGATDEPKAGAVVAPKAGPAVAKVLAAGAGAPKPKPEAAGAAKDGAVAPVWPKPPPKREEPKACWACGCGWAAGWNDDWKRVCCGCGCCCCAGCGGWAIFLGFSGGKKGLRVSPKYFAL